MSLFSREQESVRKTFLVLDIGSASVAGALVSHIQEDRPEIFVSARTPVVVTDNLTFEHFFSMIGRSLEDVLRKILAASQGSPEEIFVTLRSPWVASQTRFLSEHNKMPFIFNEDMADTLIAREINAYHNGSIKAFAEYADNHHLLEHKTMRVKLNGYVVAEPLGKRVNSVELTSFMSVVPDDVEQDIRRRIEKYFHSNISMHSFLFGAYVVTKQFLQTQHNHVLMDIGGEVTEMGIVRDDILMQTVSLPVGRHHLLRHIAKKLQVSLGEARSLLRMHQQSSLSEVRSYEVAPVIDEAVAVWTEQLRGVLHEMSRTSLIPDVLFLHAEDDVLDIFEEALISEDFHHYISSHDAFHVVPMTIETLRGRVIDREMRHDPFLIISTLFSSVLAHRETDPDVFDLL
jgi:hypothetical protein